jgi:NitT/TauT family transport system substrate-binding protein
VIRFGVVALTLLCVARPPAAAEDVLTVGEAPFISGGPFFIARDKGYFEKVGIAVKTKIFMDGALAVPAMVSGELDVTVVTLSAGLFNSIAKGAPMLLFLDRGNNQMGRGGSAINVSTTLYAAGLHGPADMAMLKGKRFGITAVGSINQYEAALALSNVGLDPKHDVQWVSNVAPPDLARMLGRELLDAADLGWQYGAYANNEKLAPLVMDGGSVNPGGQVGAYATSRRLIGAQRDVLVRFAMAIMFAAHEFNQLAAAPDKDPALLALLAKDTAAGNADLLKSFAPHWTSTSEDGALNTAAILKMQDFWIDFFGSSERRLSADDLFDLSIARDAVTRLARDKPFGP